MIVRIGNPVQTLPLSTAMLREIDIIGTFRYANTYPEAVALFASIHELLPALQKIITCSIHGLENVQQAFNMAGEAADEEGKLVLKVVFRLNEKDLSDSVSDWSH